VSRDLKGVDPAVAARLGERSVVMDKALPVTRACRAGEPWPAARTREHSTDCASGRTTRKGGTDGSR